VTSTPPRRDHPGPRGSVVPDPWRILHEQLPDVTLLREPIVEPGRYYDSPRAIVLRRGLSLEAERRYLWHELVHALRRDTHCETGWLRERMERSVEREAARRAMPTESLAAGLEQSATWPDLVWHMKVPESWVRFRLAIAHPAERALLERACRWAGRGEHSA
jgi:hypothetical protein